MVHNCGNNHFKLCPFSCNTTPNLPLLPNSDMSNNEEQDGPKSQSQFESDEAFARLLQDQEDEMLVIGTQRDHNINSSNQSTHHRHNNHRHHHHHHNHHHRHHNDPQSQQISEDPSIDSSSRTTSHKRSLHRFPNSLHGHTRAEAPGPPQTGAQGTKPRHGNQRRTQSSLPSTTSSNNTNGTTTPLVNQEVIVIEDEEDTNNTPMIRSFSDIPATSHHSNHYRRNHNPRHHHHNVYDRRQNTQPSTTTTTTTTTTSDGNSRTTRMTTSVMRGDNNSNSTTINRSTNYTNRYQRNPTTTRHLPNLYHHQTGTFHGYYDGSDLVDEDEVDEDFEPDNSFIVPDEDYDHSAEAEQYEQMMDWILASPNSVHADLSAPIPTEYRHQTAPFNHYLPHAPPQQSATTRRGYPESRRRQTETDEQMALRLQQEEYYGRRGQNRQYPHHNHQLLHNSWMLDDQLVGNRFGVPTPYMIVPRTSRRGQNQVGDDYESLLALSEHLPPVDRATSNETIANLPLVQGADDDCTICIGTAKTAMVALPCTHKFHKECIIPHLKKHKTCPNCRSEVE